MLLSMWVKCRGTTEVSWWCISLTIKRVRVAAAESMPLLLECARVRGPEYLTQMWHFMCDALIKAIGTEPDSDVLSEIMHSFAKVGVFSECPPPPHFIRHFCLVLCWINWARKLQNFSVYCKKTLSENVTILLVLKCWSCHYIYWLRGRLHSKDCYT